MQSSSQNRPLISIGMPVFNCAGTIGLAISSILNQTFDEWELLVIDDGSTDETLEAAASFGDPRIRVVRGERNRGLPTRLNECVSAAQGRYFARMDGDDLAYPDRLKRQLEFLEAHPEVDLVAGRIVVFRDDGVAYGVRPVPSTHERICAHPWRGISMPHPAWMGRTEWFLRNPYSADALRSQDQELLLRTCPASRFAALPEIVLGYRENSLSLSKILLARIEMCRMMIRIGCAQRRFLRCALGVLTLAAKGLMDTLAVSTGLNYFLLRHRALDLHKDEEREWRSVWEKVGVVFGKAIKTNFSSELQRAYR